MYVDNCTIVVAIKKGKVTKVPAIREREGREREDIICVNLTVVLFCLLPVSLLSLTVSTGEKKRDETENERVRTSQEGECFAAFMAMNVNVNVIFAISLLTVSPS